MLAGVDCATALAANTRIRAMSPSAPPTRHSDPSGRASLHDFKGSSTKFLHDNIRACMHVAAQRAMFLLHFELLICSWCTEARLGHFGVSPGPCKWLAQGLWSAIRKLARIV